MKIITLCNFRICTTGQIQYSYTGNGPKAVITTFYSNLEPAGLNLSCLSFKVNQKMDEVKDMLDGTKTSVEHLLPKSDEIFNQVKNATCVQIAHRNSSLCYRCEC